jgi:hypothetical protein
MQAVHARLLVLCGVAGAAGGLETLAHRLPMLRSIHMVVGSGWRIKPLHAAM